MQGFQNELQMLGMDNYQVGNVIPMNPQNQQFLDDSRRCGCGRCGFGCGRCGFGCGRCGFGCGGCGGCGGCFGCFGCFIGSCFGFGGLFI